LDSVRERLCPTDEHFVLNHKDERFVLHYALMYYPFTLLTTGSTGRRKLTQNALMAAPLCLPNPEEQHRRVESLDRWFSIADQLGKAIDSATQRGARLRQAILHKAFEGKLVPQDPNDEPASALLNRIRAARAQVAHRERTAFAGPGEGAVYRNR
jgi:hypothetical protein